MKKFLFVSIAVCFSLNLFAKTYPVIPELKKDLLQNEILKFQSSQKTSSSEAKPLCRVCCTITVHDQNGTSKSFTACAGDLFTGCDEAGIKACNKARFIGVITLF